MAEIIDYFYCAQSKDEYFETANIHSSKKRSSKFKKYNIDTNFVLDILHTSEDKENWELLKKYVLNLNHYDIQSLDDSYKEKYHYE
jgi:hypothetical protein